MNNNRPINLELSSLKFPPMAIASILHRLSGIVLFLALPLLLYVLQCSLASEVSFYELTQWLKMPLLKAVFWGISAALVYHLFAGIRHMIMDLGFGEHLETGRRTAVLVIVLAVMTTIFLGFWIW